MVRHVVGDPPFSWARELEYGQAVAAGELVFTARQGGFGPDGELVSGGFESQARQAFANLAAALGSHAAGLENVTKLTVYLVDRADYEAFKCIRGEVLSAPYPASTAVLVGGLLIDGMSIELDAVALIGAPRTSNATRCI